MLPQPVVRHAAVEGGLIEDARLAGPGAEHPIILFIFSPSMNLDISHTPGGMDADAVKASLSSFSGTPKSFAPFTAVVRSPAGGASQSGPVPVPSLPGDPG